MIMYYNSLQLNFSYSPYIQPTKKQNHGHRKTFAEKNRYFVCVSSSGLSLFLFNFSVA